MFRELPLWPDQIPLAFEPDADELVTERPIPAHWPDENNRGVEHISVPTLTIHMPEQPAASRAAVVIYPGGGYRYLEIDKEGHHMARWLSSLGLVAAVCKYRTCPPSRLEAERGRPAEIAQAILADGLRAVQVLRAMADELDIDPERIGAIGFSAGGHMTANVAVSAAKAMALDDIGRVSARLAFAAPIYLGISDDILAAIGPETPPMFLCDADDDTVTLPENSLRTYAACRAAGVSAELHLYRRGGHGFGLGAPDLPASAWTDAFAAWLADLGVLDRGHSA